MGTFDTARVNDALRGTIFHGRLHHFSSIDSTNTRALAEAQAGAEAGQVFIADEQTAGRGRGGHTWHSEPDRGLYCTVLLRPQIAAQDVLRLSLHTAVAAYWAIHEVTGYSIDLRWPNDLVTAGRGSRKLGGILTEIATAPGGRVRHAAVGIGINLNQGAFSDDLSITATSLRLAAGEPVSREAVAAALLRQMDGEVKRLEAGDDIFARFVSISTWADGKRVEVAEDEGYTGVTAGLTSEGLLRVACDDGSMRIVRHGGVRELPAARN